MEDKLKTSKTITNNKGEIIFFGLQHFLDDIVNGNCCFICGEQPDSKEFNDEHIIPDWILRKYNLHTKYITLPNGTKFKYSQYTASSFIGRGNFVSVKMLLYERLKFYWVRVHRKCLTRRNIVGTMYLPATFVNVYANE